ncbi:MAG: FprA family A-type flavoprotein [Desulfurococcaceae archaeon]
MEKITLAKITKNIYLARFNDRDTLYFEGLWSIPEGITYNAYIAPLPDGAVVFDGWKNTYSDLFIETIKQVIDLSDIKYIVVHHSEPDHSGSIKELLKHAKKSILIGSQFAEGLIEAFYEVKPVFKRVKDNEVLRLGGDYELVFHITPWLHWPDTIVSYLKPERVLFTCDIFGSYGVPSKIFYEDLPDNEKALFKWYTVKYFVNIIGKYVDWVPKNLDKLLSANIDPSIISTGHGPLYRGFSYIANLYSYLGSKSISKGKAIVVYTSMYRFVENAVNIVIDEMRRNNIEPKVYRFTDNTRDHYSDLLGELYDAEYLVIGTSTYDADIFPIAKYMLELIKAKIPGNKKVIIISNYGWGAVSGKRISEALREKGNTIVDVIEIRGSPGRYESAIRDACRRMIST